MAMATYSKLLVFFLLLTPFVATFGQESQESLPAADNYTIFSASGVVASWEDVVSAFNTADVILVGEQHNDSIGHQVEMKLLEKLYADALPAGGIGVSFEMFDRDVQYIVDEYLAGLISEDHMVKSARAWDNYATDYRPMLEFAKEHDLGVIAANAPRRYVNRVTRLGEESLLALSDRAKSVLPPLPVAGPSAEYQSKWDNVMADAMQHMPSAETDETDDDSDDEAGAMADEHGAAEGGDDEAVEETAATTEDHGGFSLQRMFDAQNVWDAGMAYAIVGYLTDNPRSRIIHYVGSFHVESGSGLPDHIQHYRPGTRAVVIYIHPVDNPGEFDDELSGRGDFVIQTRDFQ